MEQILSAIIDFISTSGYIGVCILMIFESMIVPIPSEAVMPFAGFLVTTHRFSFAGVLLASTIGSIIGSYLSYLIGAYGGRPFLEKWGKYFLLNHHHLTVTEKFFHTRGEWTIFIGRLIPIVRHLISIPAGIGRMPLGKFFLYTTLGAGLWNGFLAWVGMRLGEHWEQLREYTGVLHIVIIVCIVGVVAYWIRTHIRARKNRPV